MSEKMKKDSHSREKDMEDNSIPIEEAALPDAETAEQDALSKTEAELTEIKDKYLRLYSEFENYKKRVVRDRIDLIRSASAETMLSILPIIDDMERAVKAISEAKDNKAVKEGIQLVYQKMKTIVENRGLKAMDSVGKPFDPELHDAISNIHAPSEDMKGKVVEEIEKGYFLNDKVIRHAKVIVGS